jgi:hypothetical protein
MAAAADAGRVGDTRRKPLRQPALVGAAGLGAVIALHVRDPHQQGSWGFCPFRALTGLPCPGCGGLRAVNDLTNGDLVSALSSNAMAVALVLGGSLLWLGWTVQAAGGRAYLSSRALTMTALAFAAAFVVFGIFRLTPWGIWFRP